MPQVLMHMGLQPSSQLSLQQLSSLVQVSRCHAHATRSTQPASAPALSSDELLAVTTMADLAKAAVEVIGKRPGVQPAIASVVPQPPAVDPLLELYSDAVDMWGDNVRTLLRRLKQTELG